MAKRSRGDVFDLVDAKRVRKFQRQHETPLLMDTTPGRRTRRYIRRAPLRARSYRIGSSFRYKFGLPRNRGPYARVNRSLPELKSLDNDVKFLTVRMGDLTPSTDPPTTLFAWAGLTTNPFTHFSGTNKGGVIWLLNDIIGGTGIADRIGRQVTAKSILLRAIWQIGSGNIAESTLPVAIRTTLIWDKSPNGVLPHIGDIFKAVSHVANDYAQPHSPNMLTNRDRFRTLLDINDTLVPNGDSNRYIDRYVKLSGTTTWAAATGGIGSISTGALYLVLVSNNPQTNLQTAGDQAWCNFHTRFRYVDC